LIPANFTITATAEGAPEITTTTTGALNLRPTLLQVASVASNPPFVAAGATGAQALIDVKATIQSVVNQPQQDSVSYVVQDPSGKTIFTSKTMPLALTITSGVTTPDLGTFDTTGRAQGVYTLTATVADASGKPIPGATGHGLFTIGLPVTASLSTTPTTVPSGAATVTTTVQVHGQTTFPAPLTVLGQVATADDELSTVLYTNNLAYVVGANGISIIDVSKPASPMLVKTFAQSVVVQGGYNIAQIVGHDLLVATNVTLNSSGFNFIVYDLTDPMNPMLVSNTEIPYRFLTDMYVLGNVALFPIQEFDFFPGGQENYFGQSGNIVVVDISNLSAPKVLGEVFASGDPNAAHPEGTAVIVNSSLAYAVSSTETGGDTSTGVGNVRLFNISNPAAPTLAGNLNIPNTETLTNIALAGNRALVVGSSQGLLQPFNSKTAGLTGNVTLTVLDITDPNNPKVLGTTLVTEATSSDDATAPTSRRDLVNLGNGLFALSNVLEGGKPAILLLSASDPNNIVVGALQTPQLVNGLTVSGSTLYAGTPTGLTTYQIGQLVSSPVTVSVQVPKDSTNLNLVANSFDKPPTQIVSGTNSDTYVWDRSLAFGNTDLSFSWQTKLSNLSPGANPSVALGATVGFTAQGTPGTLTLAGTSVTAVPIINVSPATQTAQPDAPATYQVRLTNPLSTQATYYLSVQGDQGFPDSENFPSSVTVAPGGTVDVPLQLTAAQMFQFTVAASDPNSGAAGSAQATLNVAGTPVLKPQPDAHGIVATLAPTQASAGQGTAAQYVIQLTNTGSADDQFNLAVTGLPSGIAPTLAQQLAVDVPPGAGNSRDIALSLAVGAGVAPGSYPFTVTATSNAATPYMGSASGTLTVTATGVSVSLNKTTGAPGDTFQLTVTNTGTVQDTYNLSLGEPASLVATLAMSTVTLAAGKSTTIPITTGPVTFSDQGALSLMAVAASQTTPAVKASATASLTIPAMQGLTAQLMPATQTLAQPGPAPFTAQVENTGNTQDSYTATIVGITGPITAALVGLDGLPTQTIPNFSLPGLSIGLLPLRTTATGDGVGTVSIKVTSLSDPLRTTTLTAKVQAGLAAPTPVVTVTPPIVAPVTISPPVNFIPSPQLLHRNLPQHLSLAVADSAVASGDLQVTLTVASGTLHLGSVAGLDGASGNNTGTVVLTGPQAALNAALAALVYQPVKGHLGTVVLTMTSDDLGNGGGPAQVTTSELDIVLYNRAPKLSLLSLHGLHFHLYTNRTLVVKPAQGIVRGFIDPELDPLRVYLVKGPRLGKLRMRPDGSFTFMPPPNFRGVIEIIVRASDGLLYSPKLTVLFSVGNPPKKNR
jgi:uncharacterized membrane protein